MDERIRSTLHLQPSLSREGRDDEELRRALDTLHSLEIDHAELQGQMKEMRRSQATLEESRGRYLDLYEFAPVGYLTLNIRVVSHINVTGAALLGVDRRQIAGRRFSQWIAAPHRSRFAHLLRQVRRDGGRRRLDLELLRGDGTTFPAQLDCVPMLGGPNPMVRLTLIDISDRKRAEAEIRQLAFYDPLTKLPNRRLLMERLGLALSRCARKRECGALLFLDLDDFKTLNDTLGHSIGDLLLEEVGRRLQLCVRLLDTASRLGGDEFVVILEHLDGDPVLAAADSLKVGEKILASLSETYVLAGMERRITASMGITVFGDEQVSVQELLTCSDIALYRAKTAGNGTIRYFDQGMQERLIAHGVLLADLQRGLREKELLLHFQPQVDQRGRWIGVEALLRWQHPTRGLLSPEEFLPFAEERGLIETIGQYVFEAVCSALKRWSASELLKHLTLAMNVSAQEFRQPQFAVRMEKVMQQAGIDPRRLMLEFTEGVMFSTMEETQAKMQHLRALGVRFAVDDFGVGYSSLAYLQRLPLDQLKIDQSFVRDMVGNANDAIIVRSILALGQNLGLEVVAEGVETEAQLEMLAAHGCSSYQGFLFGRPMAEDELMGMLR